MIPIFVEKQRGFEREFVRRVLSPARDESEAIEPQVRRILQAVAKEGDRALVHFIRKFEGREVSQRGLRLSPAEQSRLARQTEPAVKAALRAAHRAVKRYHQAQRRACEREFVVAGKSGAMVGQRIQALERVAIYVPGGRAAYPSTVLMNALPARAAGVKDIVLFTPTASPAVIYAAKLCGIDEIYLCGGAQAIAAAAYGTQSIRAVDKIVGPGNLFVATAKRLVFGLVDIDMLAGPSEVLIVADQRAHAKWIAWDLLAQAEHDPLARPLCICFSEMQARSIQNEINAALKNLPRAEIARTACRHRGSLIVAASPASAARLADRVAPEHLEIQMGKPVKFLSRCRHYGAAFLGGYTPEAVGDYLAGPSHVLPTAGTARFASPLGVADFLKRSSILRFSPKALAKVRADVVALALAEGLQAHARSVEVRFER